MALPPEEYNRRMLQKLIERILIKPTGCWEWQAFRHKKGYGLTTYRRTNLAAHRLAYTIVVGPIPEGQLVCHRCDNPPCCNPAHLFLGTMVDNAQDSADKMRHFNGRKTHCKHNHEFTPANTRISEVRDRPGLFRRHCIECERVVSRSPNVVAWRREYQRKRRAEKRGEGTRG